MTYMNELLLYKESSLGHLFVPLVSPWVPFIQSYHAIQYYYWSGVWIFEAQKSVRWRVETSNFKIRSSVTTKQEATYFTLKAESFVRRKEVRFVMHS
jgi:hypothetical protein